MYEEDVVFVDSLSASVRLLSSNGVQVVKLFPFISACGVRVKSSHVQALRNLPFVKSVHINCRVRALSQPARASVGLSVFERGLYGRGVTVAVIDTGVSEHLDLTLFPYRIAAFADFVNYRELPYDDNGHGTAVAGILCGSGLSDGRLTVGVAPQARIAALKAIGENGEGNAFGILEAMQWVFSNREKYGIKVVNMSFGCPPLGKNDPLKLGAEALVKSGVTVVASAGNGGLEGQGVLSPGISPYVLTVGGADGETAAPFSSRGEKGMGKPDLVAQGVDVRTLKKEGGCAVYSGTSMAAPIVSGLAALIYEKYPSYTPERVKSLLCSTAKRLAFDRTLVGEGLANGEFLRDI